MKLLVLYEELAGYTLACLDAFAERHNAQVRVIHAPVNAVAPFTLPQTSRIELINRADLAEADLSRAALSFGPDAIFCGGWMTRRYLDVCRRVHARAPCVVGFDTWWAGTLRQRARAAFGRVTLRRWFSAAFVPGEPQRVLAHRLGFGDRNIRLGLYCCDQPRFARFRDAAIEQRGKNAPRRMLFVGRYVKEKGVSLLWRAFAELSEEFRSDWELWCAGTGPEPRIEHPRIRHLGFLQPSELGALVRDCGVFILPSDFEPWGVALHEFAAAGMPLIASNRVGAAEAFLHEGENGFAFQSGDLTSLKRAMRAIMTSDDDTLARFGDRSAALGAAHTPAGWADSLMALFTGSGARKPESGSRLRS